MDLQSPSLLAGAWLLGPALIVGASAGLGAVVARVTRADLGVLVIPAGWATGIVLATALLKAGLNGVAASIVVACVAAAGIAGWALAVRRGGGRRGLPRREARWAAGGAVAAFAIALAPIAGSGRSGVVGYVFNNDPAIHLAVIAALTDFGGSPGDALAPSSYASMAHLLTDGYPIGSYVWPLFASVTMATDPLHLWTPAIAVASAMLALVAFAALRLAGAPAPLAGVAAPLVASGYLTYSFVAQGGAKELTVAAAVYLAVTLGVAAVARPGSRPLLAGAVLAAAAALATFGVGALAWLGLPALAIAAIALWPLRHRRPRGRVLWLAGGALALIALASLPTILDTLEFVRRSEAELRDPAEVGNLLGPVPWTEALNVWFSLDYRLDPPSYETRTALGVWLAAALALAGLAAALRGRRLAGLAVVLPVVAGVAGAVVISSRYSIYLDTKSYMVLAPALGIASAAGVAALWRGRLPLRVLGLACGALLAAGVLASDRYVYGSAWVTPKDRFSELADIADRFSGRGPALVHEREQYAVHLLRELDPWEFWGTFQPFRGFRTPEGLPPSLPHTPDFDDYALGRLDRFELLVERKRPGGSLPPSGFAVAHETAHYRVWERRSPPALAHLSLGDGELDGAEPLDCAEPEVRNAFARARRQDHDLLVARPAPEPLPVLGPAHWSGHAPSRVPAPEGMINRWGGQATASVRLEAGTYVPYLQGSYGPGVRLRVDGRDHGDVYGDLGLPDSWHALAPVSVEGGRHELTLTALGKPGWQAGNDQSDITGTLVLVPAGAAGRVERVDPRRARSLCGTEVDWIELR